MMGDQRYFGKASGRTLDAAIAREWDSGLVCTAAILSRSCPLWVKSGHRRTSNQCPLYPKSGHSRARPNDAWLVRLATGRNYCVAPSALGECRTKAIDLSTEKEIYRDRSGNGLFLGWHFKAR